MLIAFRTNKPTIQILKNMARRENTTLSNIIRLAIAQYLENLTKKS